MRKTQKYNVDNPVTVDIDTLASLLSCGKATARRIGDAAGARINVGRRVLYSVDKIMRYIDKESG